MIGETAIWEAERNKFWGFFLNSGCDPKLVYRAKEALRPVFRQSEDRRRFRLTQEDVLRTAENMSLALRDIGCTAIAPVTKSKFSVLSADLFAVMTGDSVPGAIDRTILKNLLARSDWTAMRGKIVVLLGDTLGAQIGLILYELLEQNSDQEFGRSFRRGFWSSIFFYLCFLYAGDGGNMCKFEPVVRSYASAIADCI